MGGEAWAASPPEARVLVAAVQYAGSASGVDDGCAEDDDGCAIEQLIRRAKRRGARLVVTPEYALAQDTPEPAVRAGQPSIDVARAPIAARFSALADELDLYLVINLQTRRGEHAYNSQVAFGPDGRVLARHDKFELYDSERETLEAGEGVVAFDTPFGRVGLLICADLYGDPELHDALARELGVKIIAFSAMWTVPRATRWQAAFARDWGVFVVAANASEGQGRGSGVFDPTGRALVSSERAESSVLIAEIPGGSR